jgi:cold shock protein
LAQGSVLWFCAHRGYGFIRPDGWDDAGPHGGREVFVHANALEEAGLTGLSEGERVVYDVMLSGDGQPFATNLQVI